MSETLADRARAIVLAADLEEKVALADGRSLVLKASPSG